MTEVTHRSIFELLASQHRAIEARFAEVYQHGAAHLAEACAVYAVLAQQIVDHLEGEARIVYPRLSTVPELTTILDEVKDDHMRISLLVTGLLISRTTASEWVREVRRLEEVVAQHVEVEESDLFPAAERALTIEESHELASDFCRDDTGVHASAP
jgi:hemerythrin-like domain-containing protein